MQGLHADGSGKGVRDVWCRAFACLASTSRTRRSDLESPPPTPGCCWVELGSLKSCKASMRDADVVAFRNASAHHSITQAGLCLYTCSYTCTLNTPSTVHTHMAVSSPTWPPTPHTQLAIHPHILATPAACTRSAHPQDNPSTSNRNSMAFEMPCSLQLQVLSHVPLALGTIGKADACDDPALETTAQTT